jgi:hypothetical protein
MGRKVKFSTNNVYKDEFTKKPVADTVPYDYNDGMNHYRITFKRSKDIVCEKFIDEFRGFKSILAKLAGFDGAYLRFTGEVTVERFEVVTIIETVREESAFGNLCILVMHLLIN